MSPQQQAGEKTEQATPKRKREAREKGQVAKSVEIVTALSLLAMFGLLSIFGGEMMGNTKAMMTQFFSGEAIPETVTVTSLANALSNAIFMLIQIMAPILLGAFVIGVVVNVVQVGLNFSSKALAPKMERVSPLQGFKRIFSSRTLLDFLKSIIKLAILAFVAYGAYQENLAMFPPLMGEPVPFSVEAFVSILISTAFRLAIALAIFAPFDFMYQRWKHNKDLMMTKQEVKDEYKLTEGNPETKGRIAQKQRQMSSMRMVQAVSEADVVITNPTHYAVALEYKQEEHEAPLVVAKGMDYLARRIKERAEEHDVAIVENKALAQSLYFFCEVGDEVPEEHYRAVAEVLAYVFRLKNKGR